ncbi:MAG TPA: DoxX family protein [Roseiflexaceae bacterium]|nr:DoxX family protein [Roseiflexaceae bacterium]
MRSTITSPAGATTHNTSRALNIGLWVLQVLMALLFLAHGWLLVAPPAEMVAMMDEQMGFGLRMFIGVAELLAAAGLILPGVTRILPWLVPAAAAGLMIVMFSATVLHIARGETSSAIICAVIFAIVTAIAYARWKVQPIAPRAA